MAYCAIDDLVKLLPRDRLIELTDDADSGDLDAAIVQAAIDQAAEEIDAYLAVAARLPLSSVPDLLASLNAELAVCRLFRRVNTDLPEIWDKTFLVAHQTLADIAAGRRKLELGRDRNSPRVFKSGVREKEFPSNKLDRF